MMASKSWVKSHWYQISKRQILYQEDGGSTDQIERDIKALVETLVQDGLCTDPIETINFLPRGVSQEKMPKEITEYYEQRN